MNKVLTIIVMMIISSICHSDAENLPIKMDGLSFSGQLKANNTWLRVGVKGQISFRDGDFYWMTNKHEKDVQKMPYQVVQQGDVWLFTAAGPIETDSRDTIHWRGFYDGHSVTEVTATWRRVEKDFIHDLMLPEVVHFNFTPKNNK